MTYYRQYIKYLVLITLISTSFLSASGGFDHGTSTGRGQFEIDLTWNPFNYFKNGQSYVVLGYGITERLDIHGYYCDHSNYHDGVDSYYYGLFYQFLDSEHLDLATAVGSRKMMDLNYHHTFFPQFLYNIKFRNGYTIGGSLVNVKANSKSLDPKTRNKWLTFDIALFIPITEYIQTIKYIEEIKVGIGVFSNELVSNNHILQYFPTYSIDIKLHRIE